MSTASRVPTASADRGQPPTADSPSAHLRVWLNDRLVDPSLATVSALDHGLVVGDGVFEALKVGSGGAFSLTRHLNRLTRSAQALDLPEPDHDLIRAAVRATTEDRRYQHGMVRITWTGGLGPLGSHASYGPPTLVVAATARTLSPPEGYVVTAPWRRNENGAMTGVKTTSYAENVRGLALATRRGATETIFANVAGNLCEGTGSNIFCVLDGTAHTPPLAAGPLAGITRELLREWLPAAGIPVVEADLTMAQAQAADEVFVTSSLRDVQPVTRWDDRRYPVGEVTSTVMGTFAARSAADLDP